MSESIESSLSLPDAENGSNSSPSPDYSSFPSPPDVKSPPNVGGSGNSKSPPPKGSGSSSKNAPPPLDDSSSSSNSSSSLSPPPSPPPKSDSPPTSNSNNLMKTYPSPPPSNSYNSMKTSSSPPPSKSPQTPPPQNPPPPSKTLQSPPPPQNLPPPSMILQSPPPPSSPPPHSPSTSPPPHSPSTSPPPHSPSTSPPPSSSSTIPAAEGLESIPHPPAVSKSTPSPIITPPGIPPINKVSPPTDGSSSPADSGSSHASPSKENAHNTSSLRPSDNSNSKSRGSSSGSSSSPSTPDSSSTTNGQTGTIIGVTVAGVFLIALVAMIFVVMRRKKRAVGYYPNGHVRNQSYKNSADGYMGGQPRQSSNGSGHGSQRYHAGGGPDSGVIGGPNPHFTYEEMMEITNGFSRQNILGEGGFGCVFKGWLADGREVAVKKLKAGGGQGEREFKAEVEIISRVHHRYLVSLVGYCISENHRLLIYEFVSNKTLEYHLHSNEAEVLDWPKRLKIALGAAKGLAYLHEDCHPKIIHRDIKSANILLDTAYEAKVADFGLAKLSSDTKTHVSTRVMGTFGYMAPEYASSGKLTDRSDVFSFGVVLLELVTGRKPVDPSQPLGDESLVEWARPFLIHALQTGDVSELVDPRLQKHYVESEIIRMIEAAAACVRHSAPKRPRMMQVVRALDCEGEYSDLSNGVKYGQSTIYDSDQYNQEIIRFRKMAVDSKETSEYDAYNGEYSREFSGSQNPGKSTPSSELDSQNIGSGHHTIFRL